MLNFRGSVTEHSDEHRRVLRWAARGTSRARIFRALDRLHRVVPGAVLGKPSSHVLRAVRTDDVSTCRVCRRRFFASAAGAHYCSLECSRSARRGVKRPWGRRGPPERRAFDRRQRVLERFYRMRRRGPEGLVAYTVESDLTGIAVVRTVLPAEAYLAHENRARTRAGYPPLALHDPRGGARRRSR